MSLFFKAKTPEGTPLIGCHTKDPELQKLAGLAIDLFTPLAGANPAKFSETGWTVRPIAPYVDEHMLDAVLKNVAGHANVHDEPVIEEIGEISRDVMVAYMGQTPVERIFGRDQFASAA